MNILLVAYDYPPQPGGIAKVAYEIANELHRSGEDIVVVAEITKGDKEFDRNNKFQVYRGINIFFLRELKLILFLPYLALRHRIDVIYNLVWTQGGIATFLTSKLLNIPYILHAHGTEFVDYKRTLLDKIKYGPWRQSYKRSILRNAKRIIAISNFTKEIIAKLGAKKDAISVINGGVDINRFKPGLDTGGIIARYKLENKKILLTVSRLRKYKGQDIVINLMPGLLRKIPNLVYLIVGSGDYEGRLKSLVKKLNLQNNVIFTGFVDNSNIPLYYNACDIFIMLTSEMENSDEFEGLGLVFLEAASSSKPAIGAKTGGIPDAIVDGKTGYLVDLNNKEEIENRIIALLENEGLARSMGEEGRKRIIREGMDWESAVGKIRNILKESRNVKG